MLFQLCANRYKSQFSIIAEKYVNIKFKGIKVSRGRVNPFGTPWERMNDRYEMFWVSAPGNAYVIDDLLGVARGGMNEESSCEQSLTGRR